MYFDHHFLRLKAEINNNINVDVLESNQIKFTEYLPSVSITKHNSIARSCRRVSTVASFWVPQILVLIIPPYPAVL